MYDGGILKYVLSSSATGKKVMARYLHGAGQALVEDRATTPGGSLPTRWLFTDHLGTVREAQNMIGQVVKSLDYDAYGNITSETGSGAAPRLRYTGQLYDEDTGLYDYKARWYDASVGRFLNLDPIEEGTNHFIYVGNDPLNYTDPTGLSRSGSSWTGAATTQSSQNQITRTPVSVGQYWGVNPADGNLTSFSADGVAMIAAGPVGAGGRIDAQTARNLVRITQGSISQNGDIRLGSREAGTALWALQAAYAGQVGNFNNGTLYNEPDRASAIRLYENYTNVNNPNLPHGRITGAGLDAFSQSLDRTHNSRLYEFGQNHPILTGTASNVATNLAYGTVIGGQGGYQTTRSTQQMPQNRIPTTQVSATRQVINRNNLARAESARDAAGLKANGTPNRSSAAYVGVTQGGRVAVGASRPGGIHAEDAAQALVPGDQMTLGSV